MRKITRLTYLKTKTAHYIRDWPDGHKSTMCAMDVDDENWTDDPSVAERMCKRCRVAAGVPGRQVYNYGPHAWQRR